MLWERDWNKLGTLASGEVGVKNVVVIWERRERGRLSGWAYRGKKLIKTIGHGMSRGGVGALRRWGRRRGGEEDGAGLVIMTRMEFEGLSAISQIHPHAGAI